MNAFEISDLRYRLNSEQVKQARWVDFMGKEYPLGLSGTSAERQAFMGGLDAITSIAISLLDALAGAQFAAKQHLATVEQQAAVIAGYAAKAEGKLPGSGGIEDPVFKDWCSRNGMWAITSERKAFDEAVAIGRANSPAAADAGGLSVQKWQNRTQLRASESLTKVGLHVVINAMQMEINDWREQARPTAVMAVAQKDGK